MTTAASLRRLAPFVLLAIVLVSVVSYMQDGLVAVVFNAAMGSDGGIDRLRTLVLSAGAMAPVVYVLAVAVEVVLAPIPGVLLYAPGGAIFGGWWGGTLSLVGNIIGAAVAAWIGATFGGGLLEDSSMTRLVALRDRLRERGLVLVALLRLNPLTSSDLVSYAAGLAGVPVARIVLGTAVGIAPLCYLQAHAAEWIFDVLPGSGLVILGLALGYVVVVCLVLFRSRL